MSGVRGAVHRVVERVVRTVLAQELPALREEIVEEAVRVARYRALREPRVFGPGERLTADPTAVLNDALCNTISGTITVGAHAFCGHGVALLTGTHDVTRRGAERQRAVPDGGNDIEIGPGAWIASRATIVGPVRIGADAVVAAGSVVIDDVPDGGLVGGVPARAIRPSNTA